MKNKVTYIYYILPIIFVLLTTSYFNDYQLVNDHGQKDIEQYYMIAQEAPSLPQNNEKILAHVSTRYLIPYLVGCFSYITDIGLFESYRIINFILLSIFTIIILKLINKTLLTDKEKLIFYLLIFLNPYIFRHHLFNPVITHDVIFFTLSAIFLIGIIKDNYKYIIFSSLISIFIRQTSVAFLIGGLVYLLLSRNRDYKKIFLFLLSFLILFKFNSLIGDYVSPNSFNFNYAFGIIFFDFSNLDRLIRFLGLPLVSFFPLLLIIFSSFKFKSKINLNICVTCFIISVLMIGQPVLGGPEWTQRNVVRISSFCFIIASYFTIYTFSNKFLFKNNLLYYLFIIGLFFWSLHPLYSKVNLFSFLRF
ncbi:hypothetical protein OAY25_05460 [Candidatus Pelagibacter sp.]|nr:hypothetical protein [Candidatus Pelagibacter sp.]